MEIPRACIWRVLTQNPDLLISALRDVASRASTRFVSHPGQYTRGWPVGRKWAGSRQAQDDRQTASEAILRKSPAEGRWHGGWGGIVSAQIIPLSSCASPPAAQQVLVQIKCSFIQTRNSTECGRFRLVMALPLARLFE